MENKNYSVLMVTANKRKTKYEELAPSTIVCATHLTHYIELNKSEEGRIEFIIVPVIGELEAGEDPCPMCD